jgi:hypothetical protein
MKPLNHTDRTSGDVAMHMSQDMAEAIFLVYAKYTQEPDPQKFSVTQAITAFMSAAISCSVVCLSESLEATPEIRDAIFMPVLSEMLQNIVQEATPDMIEKMGEVNAERKSP